MPRWRKIHTKTVDSIDINEMPGDFIRLLWVLLPLKLDRCGRGIDNPTWVRSKAMPLREDVSNEMVARALDWYADHGMIERYQVEGRFYFWIPSWHRYQGDTEREAESEFPAPESYVPHEKRTTEEDTNLGASQEQVESKSGLDIDSDAEEETEEETKTIMSANADYQIIRKNYIELFPDKPKPREKNGVLTGKAKTRMKSVHFRENWEAALERAARSKFLHTGGFFDLGWFLKNEENYAKCLNGNYDDRGGRDAKKRKPDGPIPVFATGLGPPS